MKNAELALFELSRVISLEPGHPEVFEQRAEVSIFCLFRFLEKLQLHSVFKYFFTDLMTKAPTCVFLWTFLLSFKICIFVLSVICGMFIFKMKHTPYGGTIANRIAYIMSKCLVFDILYSKIVCFVFI